MNDKTKGGSGNRRLLIVGAVLGVLTFVGLALHTYNLNKLQRSQVFFRIDSAVSLAAGQKIAEDQLLTIALPESAESLRKVAIAATKENREWLLARPATRDVAAGSILLYDHFSYDAGVQFAANIEPGQRAMSIPVNAAAAVSFFVEPGSRVDVVGTIVANQRGRGAPTGGSLESQIMAQAASAMRTTTILQNVKVLAVGRASTPGAYLGEAAEGYPTVTIEVTPAQAEQLVFAMTQLQDGLTLLLRNPKDAKLAQLPNVEWNGAPPAQEPTPTP